MRVAVMQPYFFPYLGYFQLIRAADTFVLYDDVQFKPQSWMHRNYILLQGRPLLFGVQLRGASFKRRIHEVRVGANRPKLTRTLQQAYARAPHRQEVLPELVSILTFPSENLADYLAHGLVRLSRRLGLATRFLRSSELDLPAGLRGEARLVDLCGRLGATTYINAPGGRALYDGRRFAEAGIELRFLASSPGALDVVEQGPVRYLSIIDTLMRHGWRDTRKRLERYELER